MYKASVKVYCTAYFKCFNYQVFSCESPEGTLASEAKLDKTKMCENQSSSTGTFQCSKSISPVHWLCLPASTKYLFRCHIALVSEDCKFNSFNIITSFTIFLDSVRFHLGFNAEI